MNKKINHAKLNHYQRRIQLYYNLALRRLPHESQFREVRRTLLPKEWQNMYACSASEEKIWGARRTQIIEALSYYASGMNDGGELAIEVLESVYFLKQGKNDDADTI